MIKTHWLEDSSYEFIIGNKRRTLIVKVPNSATTKEFKFTGYHQCDFVQCLLEEVYRNVKGVIKNED